MSEKIYRVQMNSKGMPNFSTAVEIPTVNMPIKEKCCFCPHCSNCDVNDDLTIADRPQGKWKRGIVDYGFNADWKCSECGYKVFTDFVGFNYCPNCGCRMKGADDE